MLNGCFSRKPSWKRKNPAYLWILLCLAVFLSCLPYQSLIPTKCIATDSSSSLQGGRIGHLAYPDRIHEYLEKDQNSSFLSRLSTNHRIPLRLPVPHIWISYILCLIAGLQLLFRYQAIRQCQTEYAGNYIIRYIHDQNGETYRSFLF